MKHSRYMVTFSERGDPDSLAACRCPSSVGFRVCPRHTPRLYALLKAKHRKDGV